MDLLSCQKFFWGVKVHGKPADIFQGLQKKDLSKLSIYGDVEFSKQTLIGGILHSCWLELQKRQVEFLLLRFIWKGCHCIVKQNEYKI